MKKRHEEGERKERWKRDGKGRGRRESEEEERPDRGKGREAGELERWRGERGKVESGTG